MARSGKGWWERVLGWWRIEQAKICPNCGYLCTGKSVFCLPPIQEKKK